MSNPQSPLLQPRFSRKIRVSVADQQLDLLDEDTVIASYPISTSKFGLGAEPGSYRTPLGRFRIAEKIGAEAEPGMIFRGRQPIGTIAEPGGEEDHVLTRILWLDGLEPTNANTHDRFIYIHGTNQEDLIGMAASHGCVRMRNVDIIKLFERVEPGTPVEILA